MAYNKDKRPEEYNSNYIGSPSARTDFSGPAPFEEAWVEGLSRKVNDDYISEFIREADSFRNSIGKYSYNDYKKLDLSSKAIRRYVERKKDKGQYTGLTDYLDAFDYDTSNARDDYVARSRDRLASSRLITGGRNSLLPEGVEGPVDSKNVDWKAISNSLSGAPNFAQEYTNMSVEQLQEELKTAGQVRAGAKRQGEWDDADELNYILKTDFLNSAIAAGGTVSVADQKKALEEQMAGYQQNIDQYNSFSDREKADYNLFAFLDQIGINGLGAWNAKQKYEGKEQYTLPASEYVNIKEKYKAAQEKIPELQKQYDALLEQEKAQELAGILVSDPEGEIAQEYNFLFEMQSGLKDYENSEEKEQKLAEYAAQDDGYGLNEWAKAQLEQYQYNQQGGAERFFGGLGSAAMSAVSSVSKLAATIPATAADAVGIDIRDTGYYQTIAGAADKYMEENAKRKQLYANYTDNNWVLKGLSDAGRSLIEGTIQSCT